MFNSRFMNPLSCVHAMVATSQQVAPGKDIADNEEDYGEEQGSLWRWMRWATAVAVMMTGFGIE